MRQTIKHLQNIVNQAKPGENVTQEQYDIMVKTLQMARDMQKLRCSVNAITGAIVVSCLAGWAVKYGYEYDLGLQIQMYVLPVNALGIGIEWALVKKLRRTRDAADVQIKKLRQINLSKTFR